MIAERVQQDYLNDLVERIHQIIAVIDDGRVRARRVCSLVAFNENTDRGAQAVSGWLQGDSSDISFYERYDNFSRFFDEFLPFGLDDADCRTRHSVRVDFLRAVAVNERFTACEVAIRNLTRANAAGVKESREPRMFGDSLDVSRRYWAKRGYDRSQTMSVECRPFLPYGWTP
jgi:hypothetical protein